MAICTRRDFELFYEIKDALAEMSETPEEKAQKAKLRYVTEPTEEQLAGMKQFLAKKFGNSEMELELQQDASLKSGFVLSVGTKEYDWSEQGRINQLAEKLNAAVGLSAVDESILSILKTSVDDFELEAKEKEVGLVNWVGDGIANVGGIDHAFYGEIVILIAA